MKKQNILCTAIFMAVSLCLSACQPTPTTPPVANKRDFEELLKATPLSEQRFDTIGRIEEVFTNTKGDITVNISANVTTPALSKYPVIRVETKPFDEEFKNRLINYFIEDTENVYIQEWIPSKTEIKTNIEYWKSELQIGRERGFWTTSEEQLLDLIAEYEEKLKTAPEESYNKATKATTDYLFNKNGDKYIKIYQYADYPYPYINILNTKYGYHAICTRDYDFYSKSFESSEEEKQEAIIAAEKFLKYLGIEDRSLYRISHYEARKPNGETEPCYLLDYRRKVGETYVADVQLGSITEKSGDYSKVYGTEFLEMYIVGDKVVSFFWCNPDKQIEVLSENASLLPFEQVIDNAKKYIFYKQYITDNLIEIKIVSIQLNYMRVKRKDHENEYLYIPVWDFIGYELRTLPDGTSITSITKSIVTVNAIDGSNIDRHKGY